MYIYIHYLDLCFAVKCNVITNYVSSTNIYHITNIARNVSLTRLTLHIDANVTKMGKSE